ncbi:hypothetical protein TNCT_268031 [Trichonephila clavata]|uniref:Uncharacterized protein n=1 Tax=Trichonephila clavata TaxID=2740835 RepID=A0A8X6I2H4_TRICU|nr:hypothetical protein TNCT_268031 [Trichonephila clavata]
MDNVELEENDRTISEQKLLFYMTTSLNFLGITPSLFSIVVLWWNRYSSPLFDSSLIDHETRDPDQLANPALIRNIEWGVILVSRMSEMRNCVRQQGS